MKEKLTLKNVFDNPIASSIIFSLGYFVDNIGLEQKHLRFLLMNEYATPEQIGKDIQLARNIEEIQNFFEHNRKMDIFYGKGLITNGAHLNYYLNILRKPPLELIEKKPFSVRHKYSPTTSRNKYFLTAKGIGELKRKIDVRNLYSYDNSNIIGFYEKMIAGKYKGVDFSQTFYGITNEERESLTKTDKEKIDECRKIISCCLLEIEDIFKKQSTNKIHDMAFVQVATPIQRLIK